MAPPLHRLVFLVSLIGSTRQLDLKECSAPLGMESGDITDDAISGTSSFDQARVGPQRARLNVDEAGGAWCPERHISKGIREYLEIDLGRTHVLTAVSVQGRFGNGKGVEYADNFTLEYLRPGQTNWRTYRLWDGRQVLPGNTNHYLAERRELWPPVVAARLRILPYSVYARMVCMRVELHGCNKSDGLASYSLPQGASQWFSVDLTDRTYDGAHNQGQLYGGVGQLNDGAYGADDFRRDLGHGKGFEWVGWRNSTADGLLEMTFEFESVRNFSDLIIHTNADRQKNIRPFSRVAVTGSVGGRFFNTPPVLFYTLDGGDVFRARNVSVPLGGLVARFLRVQLTFAADWILVSEVAFNSEPAEGNFTEETGPLLLGKTPVDGDRAGGWAVDADGQRVGAPAAEETDPESGLSGAHMGLIGALGAVILVLVLVIVYIVHRVRGQRTGHVVTQLAPEYAGRLTHADHAKTSLGEQYGENGYRAPYSAICEKYGEPLSPAHYSEYHSQEYAEPLMSTPPPLPPVTNSPLSSCKRAPLANHSPKLSLDKSCSPQLNMSPRLKHSPKTVSTFRSDSSSSPILEQHYAATDICKAAAVAAPAAAGQLQLPGDDPDVPQIDRQRLTRWDKLGDGQFGEVHLCRIEGAIDEFPDVVGSGGRSLVAVKSLRPGASQTSRAEFEREVQTLARLRDPNIVRVLGVCTHQEPLCMVVEYMEHGDLNQFLQQHVAETAATAHAQAKILSYGTLIYMATQISSGMKYLESLNFVHRDLATRNCLVGRGHLVKISDFGMSRSMYANDYYKVEGRALLPIRWMAWESIFLGKFTTMSDVWSFAVTLWEILTYARQQPYEDLSDDRVIEALASLYHEDSHPVCVCLPQPHDCPREIYDLLLECWRREPRDRPNFREIHLFLQRKNLGYRVDAGS